MKVEFFPSILHGSITPPCSKSYAHRLLIAGALSNNECVINNVDFNNDILETINALKVLGKEIDIKKNSVILKGSITQKDNLEFTVLESGSTLRFIIPIALVYSKNVKFNCSERLIKRGIDVYKNVFKEHNIETIIKDKSIEFAGRLSPGEYVIPGNISSQYVTGLLFALSLLDKTSYLRVIKPIESEDYINITLDVLKLAKVVVSNDDYLYKISPSEYKLNNSTVEADYSNAAFIDSLNILGGKITLNNLNKESKQGDKVYIEMFKKLSYGYEEIDIKNCIDLGPILMAYAALNHGAKLNGTKRLAIKESNRAIAMKEELNKYGVDVEVYDDYVIVHKCDIHSPYEDINSHNDHRIAMSMALVAFKYGGTITNFEAINKSYPKYLDDVKCLKGEVKIYE